MPDLQVALPVGAAAFYVYDSLLLLFDNDVVFVKAGRKWASMQGSDIVIMGKRLAAPGFMAPWAFVLRSSWSATGEPAPPTVLEPERMATVLSALLPLRILCSLLLFLLVVGLPAAALSEAAPLAMLIVFAAYYLLVVSGLVFLVLARRRLSLDGKALLLMVVDALACAPFAVNLVRKVTMHSLPLKDALAFSRSHCDADAYRRLSEQITRRRNAGAGE